MPSARSTVTQPRSHPTLYSFPLFPSLFSFSLSLFRSPLSRRTPILRLSVETGNIPVAEFDAKLIVRKISSNCCDLPMLDSQVSE